MKSFDLNKLAKWDNHYIPTLKLYGAEVIKLQEPCVYGWQRGNTWLYIGFSSVGIARTLASNHHILSVYEILPGDDFYIWHFPEKTVEEVKAFEATLIMLLEPKFNKTLVCKKNPNRWGQKKPKIEAIGKRAKERNKRKKEAEELLKLVGE